eukprot:3795359-Prymnesium_polylepis.1
MAAMAAMVARWRRWRAVVTEERRQGAASPMAEAKSLGGRRRQKVLAVLKPEDKKKSCDGARRA